MADGLGTGHFSQYFYAVHGDRPFTWQQELLERVVEKRRWPDLLDLPTGSGKTAVLDVALFALALDAPDPTAPPGTHVATLWTPRRIALVVDRRVVVDQTAGRARRVARALSPPGGGEPDDEVLHAVRRRLLGLSSSGVPVRAGVLRGGLVRDTAWARWPDVPLLLSSTVDQVGSRLLHRGYGVSPGMRPVHAGLLGNDTLVLLDEVHLSQPFAATLRDLRDRYQPWAEVPFDNRWAVVEMSATPAAAPDPSAMAPPPPVERFVLDPADVMANGPDALLLRRLVASKPARLRLVAPERDVASRAALAAAAAQEARDLLGANAHVRRLGVVVNRVATAQHVVRLLRGALLPEDVDVLLLTGRLRPVDRDAIAAEVAARAASGAARAAGRRLVVVATQCIEAGADLDLDGLVTECASLDALRQRFGRVDRLGDLAEAGARAPSVVLAEKQAITKSAVDPVYGKALAATWHWLKANAKHGRVDFGIMSMTVPAGEDLVPLLAPRSKAPLLRPADLDRWVQTRPAPTPDPDPALWLHGLDAPSPDAQVVWRADLMWGVDDGKGKGKGKDAKAGPVRDLLAEVGQARCVTDTLAFASVACVPPTSAEAVPVPLPALRAWLADEPPVDVSDVEGAPDREAQELRARPVLLWRGKDTVVTDDPRAIRPGDTVVVPSQYGGYSDLGWDPGSRLPVRDVSHEAHLRARGRVTLRLHPALWPETCPPPVPGEEERSPRHAVRDWLGEVTKHLAEGALLHEALVSLRRGGGGFRVPRLGRDGPYLVVGRRRWPPPGPGESDEAGPDLASGAADHGETEAEPVDSEPDTSSFTASAATLADHIAGVGAVARAIALRCGLPAGMADDLGLAGALHDLGKADDRFQRMLHEGGLPDGTGTLLAKSSLPAEDWPARREAARLSGYPAGARHELLSVALVQQEPGLRVLAHDWDLVLHLVASHHGFARPFAPCVVDDDPRQVTVDIEVPGHGGVAPGGPVTVSAGSAHGLAALDSGVPDRFWTLVRRYGWFRLAWLEAILRLADHRRSEAEQQAVAATDPAGLPGGHREGPRGSR